VAGAAAVSEIARIWVVIVAVGIGTYLIRYSFLGIVGDRALPGWALRALRYVPVAVMPALVAPLVVWPPATGGETDPARLAAAVAALVVGAALRSVLGAVFAGMAVLYLALWVVG
jgi:branched-subunit amino acid transport protein